MSKEALLFVRPASGLVKTIGTYTVLGTVLGPSLNIWWWNFMAILPNIYPGMRFEAVYAIGAPFVLIEGAAMALVMLSMPRSGNNYVVISRGINPVFGVMEGWRSILQNPIARGILCFMTGMALGGSFVTFGKMTANAALLSLGTTIVMNPWISVVFGIVMMGIGCLIDYFGPGTTGKWMMFWVVLDVIALIATIGVFVGVGPTGLARAWDGTWGAGAYDEVVRIATTGEPAFKSAPFSWETTVAALTLPFGVTYPYTVMPWVGEVTEVEKNIPLACIGGALILIALHSSAGVSFQYAYGDFSTMYNHILWTGQSDKLAINYVIHGTYAMNLGTLAASISGNPALSALLLAGPIFGSLSDLPCGIAYTTRPLFALGFDRYAPAIFTKVSKYGSMPYNLAFTWLYSIPWIIGCGVGFLFTEVFSLMIAYFTIRSWMGLVGFSLPWYRPHIYDTASSIVRRSIFGVPWIAIVGLFEFLWCWYLALGAVWGTTALSILVVIAVYAFGIVWFIGYSIYNKKKGIDTTKIFGEVPPG